MKRILFACLAASVPLAAFLFTAPPSASAQTAPAQLPTMDMTITSQSTASHAFHWIDVKNVLLTYPWTGTATMGQLMPSPTYASTVWTKRGAKWVAVFHQETVAAPAPPAPKK